MSTADEKISTRCIEEHHDQCAWCKCWCHETGVRFDPTGHGTIVIGESRDHATEEKIDVGTGSTRSPCPDYAMLPLEFIDAITARFELGAKTHGRDNWRKGQPWQVIWSHMLRHLFRLKHRLERGEPFDPSDDDDVAAIGWGVAAMCWFERAPAGLLLPGVREVFYGRPAMFMSEPTPSIKKERCQASYFDGSVCDLPEGHDGDHRKIRQAPQPPAGEHKSCQHFHAVVRAEHALGTAYCNDCQRMIGLAEAINGALAFARSERGGD